MRSLRTLSLLLLLLSGSTLLAQQDSRNYDKEAESYIKSFYNSLDQENTYPFSPLIEKQLEELLKLKAYVEDPKIQDRIDKAQTDYYEKKSELEEKSKKAAAAQAEKEKEEMALQKRQDSIAQAKKEADAKQEMEKQAEKERKNRNLLLIVGVILAVVMFGANQLIQHLRNKKTQRNIMEMQKTATGQATKKVESKAKGLIRREESKIAGQMRQKGKNAVKKVAGKTGKNNKFSI